MARRMSKKGRYPRSLRVVAMATVAFAMVLLIGNSPAWAQQASATGKGMVGGGLLGGELVMSVEAALRVRSPWAYLIGGVVGAGGGVVGGYAVEQSADAKYSLLLLAGGMALAIPTTIAVLSATAYNPPADYQEDRASTGTEPISDAPRPADPSTLPGASPASRPAPAAPKGPGGQLRSPRNSKRVVALAPTAPAVSPRPVVGSVVNLSDGALRVGVPAVEVRPMFSTQELRQYGMRQQQELRVPLFRAMF